MYLACFDSIGQVSGSGLFLSLGEVTLTNIRQCYHVISLQNPLTEHVTS